MNAPDYVKIRRYLHQHPELSTKEFKTQAFLKKQLENLDCTDVIEIGNTGLLVHFKGKKEGKTIMLRADIDALPIEEINTFEYASVNKGISHKCGHDGHATIMLAVAEQLVKNPPEKGTVYLLFQPAEENGYGARGVLEDENFNIKPDKVFALHNLPGYKENEIVCRKGSFTAAAKSVILKLNGKTSHAAEPEKGINPGLAIARILDLSETLSQKDIDKENFALITLVHVTMGEKAYGVSAGYGEVHLTLRTWKNEVMETLVNILINEVNIICSDYEIKLETEWLEIFHANDNDESAYQIICESAKELDLAFTERSTPFKFGEDFGVFTEKFSGAMFGVGSGEDVPALHNPDYDFPDEILPDARDMFLKILEKSL